MADEELVDVFSELQSYLQLEPQESPEGMVACFDLQMSREKLRLEMEIEALQRSVDHQLNASKDLTYIELPLENLDDVEIFNDRLEFIEGDLAGNYGVASKEAVIAFYGESMPVFKGDPAVAVQAQQANLKQELVCLPETGLEVIAMDLENSAASAFIVQGVPGDASSQILFIPNTVSEMEQPAGKSISLDDMETQLSQISLNALQFDITPLI